MPDLPAAGVLAPHSSFPGSGPLAAEPTCGVYVHVPFCVAKCPYCDFYSLPLPPGRREPEADGFLEACRTELSWLPDGFRPETVFVGGGTPTELAAPDLEALLEMLRRRFPPETLREWTVESNPGTLSREKVRLLSQAGVTRVSLGVQSLDDDCLRFLGRIHTAREAMDGYDLLRAEGVRNLNLDLIAALPGAAPGRLQRDLEAVAALGPEHVACYHLTVEEGTPFWQLREQGKLPTLGEDEQVERYELVQRVLSDHGYRQYEISNHCREEPGRDLRCLHNLLYWGPGEFAAVGPSAHGHLGRARFANHRTLPRYLEAIRAAGPGSSPDAQAGARAFTERLEPERWAREALIQWLRRLEGVPRAAFRVRTGFDLDALSGREIARLSDQGLLEEAPPDRIRLTPRGVLLSDSVFEALV